VVSERQSCDARGEPAPVSEDAQSRRSMMGRLLVALGVVVGGGGVLAALPRGGDSSPSASQDVRILNFALLLEYLGAAFYADALKHGALTGELAQFATVVGGHEQAHVEFLQKALGAKARRPPKFRFGATTTDPKRFVRAAVSLEDTSVAAYNGQATNLTSGTLAAAARIVSVEARHAAWIRSIAGETPAVRATDPALTGAQVAALLAKTGFIAKK
jgi:rubrerythrin